MTAARSPSRRSVLAGGLALLATPGLRRAALAATPPLDSLLAASGLTGVTTLALADADTGAPIEAWQADTALPPASVAKVLTTLYALDALGPDYRFRTAVRAAVEGAVGTDRGAEAVVRAERVEGVERRQHLSLIHI